MGSKDPSFSHEVGLAIMDTGGTEEEEGEVDEGMRAGIGGFHNLFSELVLSLLKFRGTAPPIDTVWPSADKARFLANAGWQPIALTSAISPGMTLGFSCCC